MHRVSTRTTAPAPRRRLIVALALLFASTLAWMSAAVTAPLIGARGLTRDSRGVESRRGVEVGSSPPFAATVDADPAKPRTIAPRAHDRERAVPSSCALRVRVVDAISGAAVGSFAMACRPAGEVHAPGPLADTVNVQHSEGRGERRGLRPGHYDLHIDPAAAGYGPVVVEDVALPAPAELVVLVERAAHCAGVQLSDASGSGVQADPTPAGTCVLHLAVVGEAGEPLPGSLVLIASSGGGRWRTTTGPDGRVSVAGLPPGISVVRVTDAAHGPGECRAELTPPQPAQLRVRLARQR